MFTEAGQKQFFVDTGKFLSDIGDILDTVHDAVNAGVL